MTEKTDRELLELLLRNQEDLKQSQEELKQDVRVIKLTLENDIRRSINLLLELQISHSERFQKMEKSIQTLEDNYVIDDVIREINQL